MITYTRTHEVYLDLLRLDALRWAPEPNRARVQTPRARFLAPCAPLSPATGRPLAYQRSGLPGYPGASWGDGPARLSRDERHPARVA